MSRDVQGEAKPPSPLATVVVATLCAIVGSVFWLVCERSSGTGDSDFFDSSLWWFGFVILPGFALVASAAQPRYPRQWAILLVLPQAIATVLLGTVFHDPDDGASLWMAGLVFVGLQGMVSFGGANLGAHLMQQR